MVSYLIQSPPQDASAGRGAYPPTSGRDGIVSGTRRCERRRVDDERPAVDPLLWRPVALVILAGVASFVLGQRFAADRDPPDRRAIRCPDAVTAIGRPLVTEPAPGLPRHRLYYHWREQAWYLETDANADGRFEARQRFHAAGSRW